MDTQTAVEKTFHIWQLAFEWRTSSATATMAAAIPHPDAAADPPEIESVMLAALRRSWR